jgi:hypothetical protein
VLGRKHWHADANGQLSATAHSLRLIIRQFDGCARYLIVRRGKDGASGEIMLASGTEPSVDAAMMAAERRAKKMAPIYVGIVAGF